MARLAKVVARDNPVIISVIAPFRSTRAKIDEIIHPTWFYVKRKLPKEKHKPYEAPKKPALTLDVDKFEVKENLEKMLQHKTIKKIHENS